MYIEENLSYISPEKRILLKHGYGELTPSSISFDRFFSESEKEENLKKTESLSGEEREKFVKEFGKSLEQNLTTILKTFLPKYNIHQTTYETSTLMHYRSDWDLFFWCDLGWNGLNHMTRFSLSFNSKREAEKNMKLLSEMILLIKGMEFKNICCRIQYDVKVDEEKLRKEAERICKLLEGKTITYKGMTGKIKDTGDNVFGFFKKYAKTRAYVINDIDLVAWSLQEEDT